MTSLPQFIYPVQHENAKAAMENYVQLLQQAFEHYRNLWEDYIKLQEKYERNNIHSSSQVKTDEPCSKKKKLTLQRDVSDSTSVQKNDIIPLLELDTLNTSYTDLVNSDIWIGASNSNEFQLKDNDNNLPKSPVFSRSRLRINSTSAKKSLQLSKTIKHKNKETSDIRTHHNVETISQKPDNKLKISTTHHVETTFLPDGKKLKQSRLVFHPTKHEQKISPLNVKSIDTSIRIKPDLTKEISTTKSVTVGNNILKINETLEDVIEISPTQRNIKSKVKHYLKLKRKAPVKQMKKNSPAKNKCHNAAPTLVIEEIDFLSPSKHIPVMMEEDRATIVDSITTNVLKDKTNMIDSSPIKLFDKIDIQITKSIEAQEKKQSVIDKPQNITLNVNNPAYEDETFYLPAEQAANKSDANDFNLNDTKIQPPVKKDKLLDKFNAVPKCKDVPEQFNMRCRVDRAKLNGWDCWECKQYYENLPLSKEELQKRKNQCSRHRHKYERPRTPEGFWDLDFPETISNTYQNKS